MKIILKTFKNLTAMNQTQGPQVNQLNKSDIMNFMKAINEKKKLQNQDDLDHYGNGKKKVRSFLGSSVTSFKENSTMQSNKNY